MLRLQSSIVFVTLFAFPACGGEPAANAPESSQDEGGEEAAVDAEAEQAAAQQAQAAEEQAMEDVFELSMKLGANRAALAKQLDKDRPDCERSEVLRDRICEVAESICTISQEQEAALGHCDRSTGKCEKARRDVDDLRCRRARRRRS